MKYSTHSRKELLDFFESNKNSSFSIEEVAEALPSLGKSTVYRIVPTLEEEGAIRQNGKRGRSVLYKYFDQVRCPRHMHIRCRECGRTEHLDEETTKTIEALVDKLVGFETSASSVLEGLCDECKKKRV